jgi:hypothetical protein
VVVRKALQPSASALVVAVTEGLGHRITETAAVVARLKTGQTPLDRLVVLVVLVSPRQSLAPHTVAAGAAAAITQAR